MHLSPRDPGFPHSAILHAIVECFFVDRPLLSFADQDSSALLALGGRRRTLSRYLMAHAAINLQSSTRAKPDNTSTKQWLVERIYSL